MQAQTSATVTALREAGEDFEWYPTTSEMAAAIIDDASRRLGLFDNASPDSVLDIGAGDARVLGMFRARWPKTTCLSFERSSVLQAIQPSWVVPAGADFYEQDLMAVQATVVFCNPPYSERGSRMSRLKVPTFASSGWGPWEDRTHLRDDPRVSTSRACGTMQACPSRPTPIFSA